MSSDCSQYFLGHGSLGIVEEVKASDWSEHTFVRKRVQIPYSNRRQRLQVAQQESRILKSLAHVHIVKIIGTYEDGPLTRRKFWSMLMYPVGENDLKSFLDIFGDELPEQFVREKK